MSYGPRYHVVRVLVVEDEPRVAGFVARGLREQSFAVDVALDGADAMFQISVNDYDVIVLDLSVPTVDGMEICRLVRAEGRTMPILMLTARDAVGDRIAGLDAGADDYLVKPFAFGELVARIRALLRRGNTLEPETLTIGDLSIDIHARSAERAGRPIQLTAKEFALLEFLARNAGRVVGRSEIAEHVWDDAFDPFSNSIEVYINRLRRKIDAGSERPLIHTRRSVGYLLALLSTDADDESEA
jgi:two-component system copper resistance phosphate regulon response regulator CusR